MYQKKKKKSTFVSSIVKETNAQNLSNRQNKLKSKWNLIAVDFRCIDSLYLFIFYLLIIAANADESRAI